MYFNIKNRIFIHKLFLLLLIIPILGVSVKFYFLTLLFAFMHEAAHLCAALLKGEKMSRIFITPYGFELRISQPKKENEYFILFSGPALSLLMATVFVFIKNNDIAKINFVLFVINIIPAIPLDGGRILKVFLWDRCGAINGNIILKRISLCCASALLGIAVFKLNLWLLCISALIFMRSRSLAASPFYKKRSDTVPLRFYYFEKNTRLSALLHFVSPYNYLAVITPQSEKVIFEWDLMEKIEDNGYILTLQDV